MESSVNKKETANSNNNMNLQPQGFPTQIPQMQQPGYGVIPNAGFMPMSTVPPNCPSGLEYLTQVNNILVKQQLEILEILVSFETKNKYKVMNALGQVVYYAAEISDCCTRGLCGSKRKFEMSIIDTFGREVIHLERPLRCQSCWFPCCLQEMSVYAPPGQFIGKIKQRCNPLRPQFFILDHMENEVFKINGPVCQFPCCGDIDFKVLTIEGEEEVGRVSKQWSNALQEAFTDADNFGISFPLDLDVRMKATLLGTAFLIDFMYFEGNNSSWQDAVDV